MKHTNFWNMTNEARQRIKTQAFQLTHFTVKGRVNIQTSETSGFSLEIVMHVWGIDTSEAIQKALDETTHFYQRAYPNYTLKVSFIGNPPKVIAST